MPAQKTDWGVVLFGATEVLIGALTLIAVTISLISGKSAKPAEVLIFVLTTSMTSLGLGIGILRQSLHSYHLLLFFSTIVIFSKILIFGRIISLSGALETAIPSGAKNLISILYHALLIFYFTRPKVKEYFGERRDVLFSISLPRKRQK
ncbi:MAG: hypothetical protein FJZ09_03845 [Candidatus Omnitrophica bacterium]|nr:hypothetical protein [Candidatus Omnitrophota bacterium]